MYIIVHNYGIFIEHSQEHHIWIQPLKWTLVHKENANYKSSMYTLINPILG